MQDEEGEMKNDPEAMADILRKQYESVFIKDKVEENEKEDEQDNAHCGTLSPPYV